MDRCVFPDEVKGSWLMHLVFNMHELAITSGFAAAYRLGADFPHPVTKHVCDYFSFICVLVTRLAW